MKLPNTIDLTQDLIRYPTVTPAATGVFDYLIDLLTEHGFTCGLMIFQSEGKQEVPNLFARFGNLGPHFCFVGHLDVVPVGDLQNWKHDPYKGIDEDDIIHGRGAVDMKGAVAAFISAALALISKDKIPGSISLMLTGDEEGEAADGTKRVFERLFEIGQIPDFCLVGEPTSEEWVGDVIKIGRRGSLTGEITVNGQQGHVAYPHKAINPIPKLISFLSDLNGVEWDAGDNHFAPSNLEVVSVDVGNDASNIIPAKARALFNIRYNPLQTRDTIVERIDKLAADHIKDYDLKFNIGSEPFFTHCLESVRRLQCSIQKSLGRNVRVSTTGGTSDARFIHPYCPVIELGLLNSTAHQVDERVPKHDLYALEKIYSQIVEDFFTD